MLPSGILTRIHRAGDIKKRLKFITVSSYLIPLLGPATLPAEKTRKGWIFPSAAFLVLVQRENETRSCAEMTRRRREGMRNERWFVFVQTNN